MKNKKHSFVAELCLSNATRKNYLTFLFLIFIGIGFNSCKKDLLVPTPLAIDANKSKIKNISYAEFLNSINLNNTGILKATLSNAIKSNQGAVMNVNSGANGFNIDTDSIKKLTLGDTISYVIALKPETPHAIQFRNLTIQILNNKTTAFLTTYAPTQEFIKAWKTNKQTPFKGSIYANKISLTDLPQINGLNSTNQGSKGTVMSANTDAILINQNKISLAAGECEVYDVYEVVPYQCKYGHWPGDSNCTYLPGTENDWGAGYNIYVTTVVNCAPPATGGPGGPGGLSGGGSTTPNPPGGYDPCNCGPVTVSNVGSSGGLKIAVAAPNCCDEGSPPIIDEDPDPIAYLIESLVNELGLDNNQKNFLLNNSNIALAINQYLEVNGRTTENKDFSSWGIDYLTTHANEEKATFIKNFLLVSKVKIVILTIILGTRILSSNSNNFLQKLITIIVIPKKLKMDIYMA